MKPINGMVSPYDVPRSDVPTGFVSDARNAIITTSGIENEKGMSQDFPENSLTTIIGIIPFDNGYVSFTIDSAGISKIQKIINGNSVVTIKDSALGFNRPIHGLYSYNNSGQLVIVFWDGVFSDSNPPRMLNLDCLPFDLNPDGSFVDPEDVKLLDLTPVLNNVDLNVTVNDSGGQLKTGVYTVFFAYTNGGYFVNTNQISIIDDNSLIDVIQIDGVEGGTVTTKSIRVVINDLSTVYETFKLLIVYNDGITTQGYLATDIQIVSSTVVYTVTALALLESVSLVNELTPKLNIRAMQAGTLVDNSLYVGNLRVLPAPDIQPYINNIKVKWVADEKLDLAGKDSFRNANVIQFKRKFRTNEVYALYIILCLIDGNKYAYPLVGREARAIDDILPINENDTVQDVLDFGITSTNITQSIAINPAGKWYQFFDTARADGTMGFWENEDETYPNTDCFLVKNAAGEQIGDLRNTRVRHFRFPSIGSIESWLGDSITSVNAVEEEYLKIAKISFNSGFTVFDDFVNNAGTEVSISVVNNIYTILFLKPKYIRVFLWHHLDDDIGGPDPNFNMLFRVTFEGNVLYEHIGSDEVSYGTKFNLYAAVGTKIELRVQDEQEKNPSEESRLHIFDLNLNEQTVESRLLGVQLSDVFIPDNIKKNILYYELGYAERNGVDITCIGQTTVFRYKDTPDDKLRSHPFDMLYGKVSSEISYIDTQLKWTDNKPHIYNTYSALKQLRAVNTAQYVPAGVTSPVDNEYGEEHLYIELNAPIGAFPLAPIEFEKGALADIMLHRTNMYINLFDKRIVSTGYRFSPDTEVTGTIYGGDTFLSLYGVIVSREHSFAEWPDPWFSPGDKRTIYEFFYYPTESIANINYRHLTENGWYAPKRLDFVTGLEAMDGTTKEQNSNGLGYNPAYSSVNNLVPITIRNCEKDCDDDVSLLPYSIYRSLSGSEEAGFDNWRVIPVNQYFEMPHQKRSVWKLATLGNSLIIHTRLSLFVARHKDTLTVRETVLGIGSADIFDTRPQEIFTEDSGYFGCTDAFAAFVFKGGYVAVDREGVICIFDGSRLIELTSNRFFFRKFFRDRSQFGSSTDDPYRNSGWTAAYDADEDRLIFCKKADNVFVPDVSFTISFQFGINNNNGIGSWASFSEYVSNRIFRTKFFTYAVNNSDQRGVYRLHGGAPGYYFNKLPLKQLRIDIPLITNPAQMKNYTGVEWISHVYADGGEKYDETFTGIVVFNDNQCSGIIPLTHYTGTIPQNRSLRVINGIWFFSNFTDIVSNLNEPCVLISNELNTSNLDVLKAWNKRRLFSFRFIVVRLIYNNESGTKIVLSEINTSVRKLQINKP